MKTSFPVWSADGVSVLIDEDGREVWLEEGDIRRLIGKQQLGVRRNRDGERKIVLKVAIEAVFPRAVRRLVAPSPYCVLVTIGDTHRAYMHVAERCESYFDGRLMPINESGRRRNWKLDAKCL